VSEPQHSLPNEAQGEKIHLAGTQTKPIQKSTPQKKAEAEILRNHLLLGTGGLIYIIIAFFIMFAGNIDTKERIDILLKFILPLGGSMIGFSIGVRK
jgi:hypothetical protein